MLTQDPLTVYAYSVGDIYDEPGCTATDDVDGIITCDHNGTVNTAVIGEYIVSYFAEDSSGNVGTLDVTYVVMRDATLLDTDLSTYYDSAEGLYGTDLLLALRDVIQTGFTGVSYGDSRDILDETDRDPNNSSNLILVYLGTSVSGVWDDGVTWNREHVWPQSLMLETEIYNTTTNIGSDLHNLKPANPSENSSRSNDYYAEGGASGTYEPRNAVKGDAARILFYMTVMYDYLELINGVPVIYQMALLDTLIDWHENDIVDTFEQNRNNVIDTYQHNRNPFIDYPHLFELIYFDHEYYA